MSRLASTQKILAHLRYVHLCLYDCMFIELLIITEIYLYMCQMDQCTAIDCSLNGNRLLCGVM